MEKYSKYDQHGDLHWKWYNQEGHNYKRLVDDSLSPFRGVEKGLVLDVGMGDGLPAYLLLNDGFSVFGVEPEAKAIGMAFHNVIGKGGRFSELDAYCGKVEQYSKIVEETNEMSKVAGTIDVDEELMATTGKYYDYLYSLNTIEHVDDPKAFISLMKRVKNFGIVITDKATDDKKKHSRFHNQEFTIGDLREIFKGFRVEEINISHPTFIGVKIENINE